MLTYLSPTSLALFQQDETEFYLRYLAAVRPPRIPQTRAMAVGSAFDVYIKTFLYKALFGKCAWDEDGLFESSVEEHNRVWAREHGLVVFNAYKESKALWDLLADLQTASVEPRFEFSLSGVINGVPLLGKPDIHWVNKEGLSILSDWKVNGYCSNSSTSPKPGYTRVRGGRNSGQAHRDCVLSKYSGLMINMATRMEGVDIDWAQQLAIYGWLCGESVGGQFVVAIDQIVCPGKMAGAGIRVAEYRGLLGVDFQLGVHNKLRHLWEVITSGHIFRDMTLEDSIERCKMLDGVHKVLEDGDEVFKELTRASIN